MILLALLRQSAPTIMGLLSDCTFAFLALKYFDLVFTLKCYNNNFQSTTLMLAFEWFLTNIGIQSFNTEFNNMHHLCLLVCGVFYIPTWDFFTQTSPLPVKGLQILTYARHSWPLSSEGSLACLTYCDTGHPFIMVIS